MSKGPADMRPDIRRMYVTLDEAPDKAVFVDGYGHAWQKSAYLGTWYRAYDADGIDTRSLAWNALGGSLLKMPAVVGSTPEGRTP